MNHAFYVGVGHSRHLARHRYGRKGAVVTMCGRWVEPPDVHPSPRDADCQVCLRAAKAAA